MRAHLQERLDLVDFLEQEGTCNSCTHAAPTYHVSAAAISWGTAREGDVGKQYQRRMPPQSAAQAVLAHAESGNALAVLHDEIPASVPWYLRAVFCVSTPQPHAVITLLLSVVPQPAAAAHASHARVACGLAAYGRAVCVDATVFPCFGVEGTMRRVCNLMPEAPRIKVQSVLNKLDRLDQQQQQQQQCGVASSQRNSAGGAGGG